MRSGTRQWLVGEAQWQQFRRALARGAWRRALPATPASQPVSLLRSPAAGGASGRMLSCAAHAAWSLLPAAPRSPPAAAPAASPAAAGGSASCWLQQRRGAGTVQSSAGWFGGGAVWGQEVTARECIPYRLQHHPIAACCICQAAVAPIHPPTHPPTFDRLRGAQLGRQLRATPLHAALLGDERLQTAAGGANGGAAGHSELLGEAGGHRRVQASSTRAPG